VKPYQCGNLIFNRYIHENLEEPYFFKIVVGMKGSKYKYVPKNRAP
jgi:hypothetical protein